MADDEIARSCVPSIKPALETRIDQQVFQKMHRINLNLIQAGVHEDAAIGSDINETDSRRCGFWPSVKYNRPFHEAKITGRLSDIFLRVIFFRKQDATVCDRYLPFCNSGQIIFSIANALK